MNKLLVLIQVLIQVADNVQPSCRFHGSDAFNENRPALNGPVDPIRARKRSPAAPMPTMPAVVVAVPPPSHLGGCRLGILLDRRGGAGIAERQRLGALGRSGQEEQCANGGKPQNFRHLHV
jgi:hypothetical protein